MEDLAKNGGGEKSEEREEQEQVEATKDDH
jgi:hypothetical protein